MPNLYTKRYSARNKDAGTYTLNAERGFSLLEIILSLFLIIAIGFLLFSVSGTLFTTRSSRLQQVASKIATKDIENLRNTQFASLPASGPFTDADLAKLPQSSASRIITDYSGNPKIKHVTLTINWVDKNVSKNLTTDTLIYENGL